MQIGAGNRYRDVSYWRYWRLAKYTRNSRKLITNKFNIVLIGQIDEQIEREDNYASLCKQGTKI